MNTPTREDFEEYVVVKLKIDDIEYSNKLWNILCKLGWKKKDGSEPESWEVLTNVYNGILLQKVSKKPNKAKKETVIINEIEEDFPDNGLHYVCYTDGSCDNLSQAKAGGSAYIVIKDGEVFKMKSHGTLNTTNNRMELLAIISAVNSCPQGAFVDVYTDSQYSILVLSKSFKPKKNPDLYELYKKCSAHVAGVRFHWVKGHDGNKYNELADNLAYGAYCEICDAYGIEKSSRH